MMRTFVRLRKITLLRLKYWMERKEKESLIRFPTASALLTRADEIREKWLAAQRTRDERETAYYEGAQGVIDWIVNYGDSEEKGGASR